MADKTGISWTEATWNPVVGCKAVSPGCDNCYAAREASGRLKHLPVYAGLAEAGVFTGEVRCLPERLDQPLRWKRPRRIFVNSMSDLFHPSVPESFVAQVFDVMRRAHWHEFQVLTKRPQLMARTIAVIDGGFYKRNPLPNVWLGTSIESDKYAFRANYVRETPAAVRFLSLEPLLSGLPSLDLTGIDWVIVGGESGTKARPMHPRWVRDVRDKCVDNGVRFFFKQWGEWCAPDQFDAAGWDDVAMTQNGIWLSLDGTTCPTCYTPHDIETAEVLWYAGKKYAGCRLDGEEWNEYPVPPPVYSTDDARDLREGV